MLSNKFFNKLAAAYKKLLAIVLSHRWIVVVVTVCLVTIGVIQAASIPKAASPAEDVGFIMVVYSASHNESVKHMFEN